MIYMELENGKKVFYIKTGNLSEETVRFLLKEIKEELRHQKDDINESQ